jgi:hypothetical protein
MEAAIIAPRRVLSRELRLGMTVWAPFGERGWRAATVTGVETSRGDLTIVHLSFGPGGAGTCHAGELYLRKPELKGEDKP